MPVAVVRAGRAIGEGGSILARSWLALSAMFNLSAANLIGGFVFGSIGFVAFIYGKRINIWKPMLLGIALMGLSLLC